jgi:atrial natriuretic peptide receptor A
VKIGGLHIALHKEIHVVDDLPVKVVPSIFGSLLLVCIVAIAIILVTVYAWYRYQRRKLLYDESWIIDYDQIERDLGYRGFMGSMVSMKWMESDAGGLSSGEGYISNVQRKQLFTQTGMYQGRVVAIKKVLNTMFSITKQVREEVRQMREIYHPNLCKFIGATVKPPNIAIITEYGPKGSLNDVLQNDDIPLNWGFRFSFATDIARGLSHLHRHHLSHGRLKSSNCIIDDRWVVKVTDYGLSSLRCVEGGALMDSTDVCSAGANVYLAPERRGNPYGSSGPPSDVYSFGIILVEIGARIDPYSDDLDVDGSGRPRLPNFKEQDCPCPMDYQELICRCWSQYPTGRPTTDQVKRSLQSMNPNKESPVDMMMTMMEKYSKHLEVLVAERTQDLIAEQKKTDALLHSMLPKEVANHLRQGKATTAQSFQCATIFFSDIVGFTALAGSSTPLQIVKLLNELYTTFDTITDTYDVYKVETIGDAYMVVSGVPRENGILHASEIANMAIDMIAASQKFKIPHRTDETLQIRCGMHSGPVVAGVVGAKMPRYCLFGDTVNTASRMESTSEAMKVQASDAAAQLLKKNGGFQLECRGSIQVKGKGTMLTWWLCGRENNATSPARKASIPSQSLSRPGTSSGSKPNLKSMPTRMGTKISLPGAVEE